MTLLNEQTPAGLSPCAEDPLTLWGYSPSALHDLFWLSKEVAVVRPGSTTPLPPDARLFMLVPAGRLFRLHLRHVLDRLFWMPRALYFIGLNPPARPQPVNSMNNGRKKKLEVGNEKLEEPGAATLPVPNHGQDVHATNSAGAAFQSRRAGTNSQLLTSNFSLSLALPARMALTPHRQIAEFWRTISTTDNRWMCLRRRYCDFGSIKVPGIAYADCGIQAMDYLQALARDWPDPESAIPGIARLARHVLGPKDFDMSIINNTIRPLWIGNGRIADESIGAILPDMNPAMRTTFPDNGRKQ